VDTKRDGASIARRAAALHRRARLDATAKIDVKTAEFGCADGLE